MLSRSFPHDCAVVCCSFFIFCFCFSEQIITPRSESVAKYLRSVADGKESAVGGNGILVESINYVAWCDISVSH